MIIFQRVLACLALLIGSAIAFAQEPPPVSVNIAGMSGGRFWVTVSIPCGYDSRMRYIIHWPESWDGQADLFTCKTCYGSVSPSSLSGKISFQGFRISPASPDVPGLGPGGGDLIIDVPVDRRTLGEKIDAPYIQDRSQIVVVVGPDGIARYYLDLLGTVLSNNAFPKPTLDLVYYDSQGNQVVFPIPVNPDGSFNHRFPLFGVIDPTGFRWTLRAHQETSEAYSKVNAMWRRIQQGLKTLKPPTFIIRTQTATMGVRG